MRRGGYGRHGRYARYARCGRCGCHGPCAWEELPCRARDAVDDGEHDDYGDYDDDMPGYFDDEFDDDDFEDSDMDDSIDEPQHTNKTAAASLRDY